MKPTLNLGCGNDKRGTVRIDRNPARSARTIIADAHFIPLRDKAISKTLCKSVLEHVEAPIKVILEMKRITADEIIVVTPNMINLGRMWINLKRPLRKVNAGTLHLQGWDIKLIGHIANATGLKIISLSWGFGRSSKIGFIVKMLKASHMTAVLKDVGEVCEKCGTPKKRLWCEPDFSYCPKCDIDGPECTQTMA